MERENFRETLQHGTTAFPIAIYNNMFSKHWQVLAHLHYHNEFELLVATKGTLCIQMEESSYLVSPGEGIFINSGRLHTITARDRGEHGFIAVVFDYTLICNEHETAFTKYLQPLINGSLRIGERLSAEVCGRIRSISEVYETGEFGSELYIKQCLLHIFYLMLKDAEDTKSAVRNGKSRLVKEVLDYIKKNYGEPMSLQLLAEQVHVSKEYLCRTFRSLSDSSPIEYLNRYRIRQSTFLLVQTDKSISEIAQACGFNHSSYYGKLFYEYMGCTPTEYRKGNT